MDFQIENRESHLAICNLKSIKEYKWNLIGQAKRIGHSFAVIFKRNSSEIGQKLYISI